MKKLIAATLMFLVLATSAQAQPKHNKKEIALLVSTIAFSGFATYMDMKSSLDFTGKRGPHGYPLYESSSWYSSGKDKGFHTKGIVTMWSITTGISTAEYLLWDKKHFTQVLPEALGTTWGVRHLQAWRHNVDIVQRGQVWATTK